MAFFRLFAIVFRHFAWRISSFRLALFRLFVISLGIFSLFRLFTWRCFVLAPRHNAKNEITKWHKRATIVSCRHLKVNRQLPKRLVPCIVPGLFEEKRIGIGFGFRSEWFVVQDRNVHPSCYISSR